MVLISAGSGLSLRAMEHEDESLAMVDDAVERDFARFMGMLPQEEDRLRERYDRVCSVGDLCAKQASFLDAARLFLRTTPRAHTPKVEAALVNSLLSKVDDVKYLESMGSLKPYFPALSCVQDLLNRKSPKRLNDIRELYALCVASMSENDKAKCVKLQKLANEKKRTLTVLLEKSAKEIGDKLSSEVKPKKPKQTKKPRKQTLLRRVLEQVEDLFAGGKKCDDNQSDGKTSPCEEISVEEVAERQMKMNGSASRLEDPLQKFDKEAAPSPVVNAPHGWVNAGSSDDGDIFSYDGRVTLWQTSPADAFKAMRLDQISNGIRLDFWNGCIESTPAYRRKLLSDTIKHRIPFVVEKQLSFNGCTRRVHDKKCIWKLKNEFIFAGAICIPGKSSPLYGVFEITANEKKEVYHRFFVKLRLTIAFNLAEKMNGAFNFRSYRAKDIGYSVRQFEGMRVITQQEPAAGEYQAEYIVFERECAIAQHLFGLYILYLKQKEAKGSACPDPDGDHA